MSLFRPIARRWRMPSRATRRWWNRHRPHGVNGMVGGGWWCRRCRVAHYPRTVQRWRIG